MKPIFTSRTGILPMVPYLSLALITAQTQTGTDSSGEGPPVTPTVQETRVPRIVADQSCGSGQRRVLDTFRNRVLIRTEKLDCVPRQN